MRGTEEFDAFVRDRRIELGMTLRSFSRKIEEDAGNVSKIERGKLASPESKRKLRRFAATLKITEESELKEFLDLASVSRGEVPVDILSDKELVRKLPLVFRTVRGGDWIGKSWRKSSRLSKKPSTYRDFVEFQNRGLT